MAAAALGLSEREYAEALAAEHARAAAPRGAPAAAAAPSPPPSSPSPWAWPVPSRSPSAGAAAAAFDVDRELAAAMQRAEVDAAARAAVASSPRAQSSAGAGAGAAGGSAAGGGGVVVAEDPLWGSYTSPPGGFRPGMALALACCPCCLPPCGARRRAACGAAGRSASFVFALVQVALVLASLAHRGAAPLGVNPLVGPYSDTLDALGAKNAARIVYGGEAWRLVTPLLLHGGLVHLAANLLLQARAGLLLEASIGTPRYLVIYVASGVVGALASCVLLPGTLSVGASGALMGVLGASAALALAGWGGGAAGAGAGGGADAAGARAQALLSIVVNVAVVLAFSLSPTIDWTAHVFGLVAGGLLGVALLGPDDMTGGAPPPPSSAAAASATAGAGAREWRPSPPAPGGGGLSPRSLSTSAAGVFSRTGAGLLLEPPDGAPWATARRTACGCARAGGPCGRPLGPRAAGAAGALAVLAAALAALLWGPAPPAVRPPRGLLDVCGGLRAAGYDIACGGWP